MCSGGDLLSGSPTTPAEFQGICTKFLEVAKTKFKTLDFEVFDARAQGRALAALLYPVQVDTKEVNATSLQAALVHVSLGRERERERERLTIFFFFFSLSLSLSLSLSQEYGFSTAALSDYLLPVLRPGSGASHDLFPHLNDEAFHQYLLHARIESLSGEVARAARRVRRAQEQRRDRTAPAKSQHERMTDELKNIHTSKRAPMHVTVAVVEEVRREDAGRVEEGWMERKVEADRITQILSFFLFFFLFFLPFSLIPPPPPHTHTTETARRRWLSHCRAPARNGCNGCECQPHLICRRCSPRRGPPGIQACAGVAACGSV